MNIFLILYYLLLGVISILGQTILLREISASFYGNEIFYGLGLGAWFAFSGLGSLIEGKYKFFRDKGIAAALLLLLNSVLLPLIVIFLRCILGYYIPTGEIPGYNLSLFISLLAILLYCLPLGMAFPAGINAFFKTKYTNRAYFWETLGITVGGVFFTFIIASTTFPLTHSLHLLSMKWKQPDIARSFNTKHYQVNITSYYGQENIFLNGRLAFTSIKDIEAEKITDVFLSFMNSEKNIYVVGNPITALALAEKLPSTETFLGEIDEELAAVEKDIIGENVSIMYGDPRRVLKDSARTGKTWDSIVYDQGNPETLSFNRYYTYESFAEINKALSPEGVFFLVLYLPTDYQSSEALKFVSSIQKALEKAFVFTRLIVLEDQIVYIASEEIITPDLSKISLSGAAYVDLVMRDEKNDQVLSLINTVSAKINKDHQPSAYYYQQMFWQTIHSFSIPETISRVSVVSPIIFTLLFVYVITRPKKNIKLGLTAFASSFALISIEIIVIMLFQIKIGYLYSSIGLIFSTALLGMGLGVLLGERVQSPQNFLRPSLILLLLYVGTFYALINLAVSESQIFWFLIILIAGSIAGLVYALVNRIYLQKEKNSGYIYSFDLFGGCVGAFMTSGFVLPVYGTNLMLIFIAIILLICLFAVNET